MKRALLLAAVGILAGCSTLRVAERELDIRYLDREDRLDFVLVLRGVTADGDIDSAEEFCQRIIEGKRAFSLGGWYFEFDLDSEEALEDLSPEDRLLVDGIEILDAYAFLDTDGRLGFVQHGRIHGLSELVTRLNQWYSQERAESLSPFFGPEADKALDVLDDPASSRLQWEAANSDWTWFRFDGQSLVFHVPATRTEAARTLREWIADAADSDEIATMLSSLESVEVLEGATTLVFGRPHADRLSLALPGDGDYDPRVREALDEAGVEIAAELDVDSLRNALFEAQDEEPDQKDG